jgi:hypothetical protein
MSLPFTKTKTQTLELTTFLDFGKYKDCRVDSIIEQDHEYIQYLKFNKIKPLAPSVLEALSNKFSANSVEVKEYYPDSFDVITGLAVYAEDFDEEDVPF